jgi:hypothetical protein
LKDVESMEKIGKSAMADREMTRANQFDDAAVVNSLTVEFGRTPGRNFERKVLGKLRHLTP